MNINKINSKVNDILLAIEIKKTELKARKIMGRYLREVCKERGIKPNFNKMDDELLASILIEAGERFADGYFDDEVMTQLGMAFFG